MSQADDEFEEEVQKEIRGIEFRERQKRVFDEAWRRRPQKRDWEWWLTVVLCAVPLLAVLVGIIRVFVL